MRDVALSGSNSPSRSCAVKTATTPGAALAFVASIATMRAWAWSLRRNATCNAFGTCRSSTKLPCPVSSRGSSVRLMRAPMIFGRRCAVSSIGIGSLAQGRPLPVVVAVEHGGAAGRDAPDLGQGLFERGRVPGVARHDALIERLAQADGVRRQQER